MSSPQRYQRGFSFSGYQANQPAAPLPGPRLDIELDRIASDLSRAGASAYQIAVLNGFVGSELDYLASLVGPQGAAGPQGAPGAQGATGPQGAGTTIKGTVATPSDLPVSASKGDTYIVTGASSTPPAYASGDGLTFVGVGSGAIGPGNAYQDVGPIRGPAGVKGDKGDLGATGSKGDTGATGVGVKGDKGDKGDPGAQGFKGDKGDPGATGAAGAPGATGATGPAPDTSAYPRLNATTNTYNPGSLNTFRPTGKLAGPGGDGAGIEIRGDGTPTGGAFLLLHRPSAFATRVGLNGNNEFVQGGFSDGEDVEFRFWTEKNFRPSGVSIDAYNEFGVRADGTDQTVKIKNALAKAFLTVTGANNGNGGGTVVLPWGVLIVSDTIVVPGYCGLIGQGPTQTMLEMQTPDRAVIMVPRGNEFVRVSNIGTRFAGGLPATEAATGFLIQANYGMYSNIHAQNTAVAFAVRGGNNNLVNQYFAVSFSLVGLLNEGTTETQSDGSWRGAIDNFFISGRLQNVSSNAYAQAGTVRLVNNCEGFNLDHLSCLGGSLGLVVETVDNVHGHRPQFMTITNCMFDSHVMGSQLNYCSQSRFSNVWWAGTGVSDAAGANTNHTGYDGVSIGPGCFDLTFDSGWSNNNAGAGMLIANGAKGITVNAMTFQNNGVYARAWGILCEGQGFTFTSNRFLTGQVGGPGNNNQKVSVFLTANASGGIVACNWSDHTWSNQSSNPMQVGLNFGLWS